MTKFVVLRCLHAVLVLFGVSVVVFSLLYMIPGNPLDILLPPEAPQDVIAKLKIEFGFDKPLYEQYSNWLVRALKGDFGTSIFTGLSVGSELFRAIGNTFIIAVPAALIGFIFGTLFGAIAAFHHRRPLDGIISTTSIIALSMPHYWLGIVLVAIFAVTWNVLPAAGIGPSGGIPRSWNDVSYLVLPVLTLAMIPMGVVGRMVRVCVLDVLNREFPVALEAKGLRSRRIIYHVMKNAAPQIVAVMGLQLGYLLAGGILVETVFNWPGSGKLLSLAIFRRDIPVLQGAILALSSFFVVINLLVDVAQGLIDPRIRR
jgi:peptide/nickel transport system permease protein